MGIDMEDTWKEAVEKMERRLQDLEMAVGRLAEKIASMPPFQATQEVAQEVAEEAQEVVEEAQEVMEEAREAVEEVVEQAQEVAGGALELEPEAAEVPSAPSPKVVPPPAPVNLEKVKRRPFLARLLGL